MGAGIFNIGASLAQGDIQASALRSQSRFAQMQHETNRKLAEMEARDVKKRGTKEAQRVKRLAKQTAADAKASAAARGVDVGFGSAADIEEDIEFAGELDAIQIENNAYRQAFGYKIEAQQSGFAGRIAALSGDTQARSTLLTSRAASFGSLLGVASTATGNVSSGGSLFVRGS